MKVTMSSAAPTVRYAPTLLAEGHVTELGIFVGTKNYRYEIFMAMEIHITFFCISALDNIKMK
jgi:hypothetical protein